MDYPAIRLTPGKQDLSKAGTQEGKTIPLLHEARPNEGGAWIIREKEKRELANRVIAERMGCPRCGLRRCVEGYGVEGNKVPVLRSQEDTRPRDIGTGTRECDSGKKGA